MADDESAEGPVRYEIRVAGMLDASWSDWFDQLTLSIHPHPDGPTITTLTGDVVDQAALHGILNKIWDLNLELISVTQIEENAGTSEV